MLAVKDREAPAWTEQALGEAIRELKDGGDDAALTLFLEDRLADEDPCCVGLRARFWNELGLTRMAEDADHAVTCFREALLLSPQYTAARYNLGTHAMQTGDFPSALAQYKAILSEDPNHFDSLFNAGLCHAYGENMDQALPMFMKAADLRPGDGRAQYLTGEALLHAGRAREALPYFRAAYRENHGHFESAQGFSIALLENQEYEEAIQVCDQTLITFGAAALPLQIKGDALLGLDRVREAVTCHVDLCRLDLDIRDFVVSRLHALAKENPEHFDIYAAIVREDFPEFESILGAALNRDRGPAPSVCSKKGCGQKPHKP